jgi:pyruvate/2-oxoglutarate dehydrogenase complex dihydrolipoamide dehydrogenase (E3) component
MCSLPVRAVCDICNGKNNTLTLQNHNILATEATFQVKKYDAIIIGTGQAGPSLAFRLTQHKMQTAIIERKLFGGTCVNVGCIPTKTLVASARAAYMARRGQEFGVLIDGTIKIDMKRVKARKDAVVRQSREGLANWLKNMPNLAVYDGHGRFEGPHTIRVNDELLEADRVFINVGARAVVPDMPGLDQVNYLTNSSMMEVDYLPEHLIVVGGSYIGLEFAQMYRRFGSQVSVIQRGQRLMPRDDKDVSLAVKEILENEGIKVNLDATCIAMENRDGRVIAKLDCQKGPTEVVGSHLLLAVGRRPNTDDLGLDKAGIETNKRGFISVNDQLQTNVPGVWALGDVNGRSAFTHTSYNDYEIVAANLLDNDFRRLSDRILCYGLYIDPPLGRAGMTETEVRKSGQKALIGKLKMKRVGRATERSETQGFMKVLIDKKTQQILGAAVLGIGGDEVIHSILDVMYAKAPYTVIQRAVHIHPTVTELIPTMLGDLKPLV